MVLKYNHTSVLLQCQVVLEPTVSRVSNVIDRSVEKPIYSQIAEKLKRQILEGQLKPGSRLPSVRELMELYATTNHTIQRAVRTLESAGLVSGKPGSGVYVTYGALSAGSKTNVLRVSTPGQIEARIINEFQREVPGGKIVLTREKPDVVSIGAEGPSDDLADVGELVEDIFGYAPDRDEFFASLQHKGRNVVVPTYLRLGVMLCNVEAFESRGVPLPQRGWTWADLVAAARELNRPGEDRYGIYLSGLAHLCASVIWQQGGALFSPDGRRCRLDSEEGIAVGRLVRELAGYAPPDGPVHQWEISRGLEEFAEGRIAMLIAPSGMSAEVFRRVSALRWSAVPLPTYGAPAYLRFVCGYGLSQSASAPALAEKFLRLAAKCEKTAYAAGEWHGLPLYAEHARHDESEAAYRWTATHARDPLSDVLPEHRNRRQEDAFRLVVHEFSRISTSNRPVAEVMRDLSSQLNALLTEDRHGHY